MNKRNRILEHGHVFTLSRYARDSDWLTHGAKGGDWLHLTPSHALSSDCHKAICFLEERAATIYLKRLPWNLREQFSVISCGSTHP